MFTYQIGTFDDINSICWPCCVSFIWGTFDDGYPRNEHFSLLFTIYYYHFCFCFLDFFLFLAMFWCMLKLLRMTTDHCQDKWLKFLKEWIFEIMSFFIRKYNRYFDFRLSAWPWVVHLSPKKYGFSNKFLWFRNLYHCLSHQLRGEMGIEVGRQKKCLRGRPALAWREKGNPRWWWFPFLFLFHTRFCENQL